MDENTQPQERSTVSLPKPLWKRVRRVALDNDLKAADIVVTAIESELERLEQKQAA